MDKSIINAETLGEQLVRLLAQRGVEHVFGIPGAHTIELYRGLASSPIQHVTPRHEQGAGFMADGYARVSGKPGVAFVITGPGLLNIATPMAQAKADSIPILVIAAVNPRPFLGMGSGNLHELHRQLQVADSCSVLSHSLCDATQLQPFLDKAFAVFDSERPGPVYLEIPVDLFAAPAQTSKSSAIPLITKPAPATQVLQDIATELNLAKTPLILAGGGSCGAAELVPQLAQTLDAPVVMTANARGVLAQDHPLAVSASASMLAVRQLVDQSDVVLALGTEFGSTDYDMYVRGAFTVKHRHIRVDISGQQLSNGCQADIAVLSDCEHFVQQLLPLLSAQSRDGQQRATATMRAAWEELDPEMQQDSKVLQCIRQHFPSQAIIGDSTQLVYAGNLYGGAPSSRTWFNASTGFGALGFGLPATIGAAIASGETTVCLTGDGGLQFCLGELAVAVQEQLPVVVIVWNNLGYGEIERYMRAAKIDPVGVTLHTPDFVAVAEAMGLQACRASSAENFKEAMTQARDRRTPYLIELDEQLARTMLDA